jgi:hypothetical protein
MDRGFVCWACAQDAKPEKRAAEDTVIQAAEEVERIWTGDRVGLTKAISKLAEKVRARREEL